MSAAYEPLVDPDENTAPEPAAAVAPESVVRLIVQARPAMVLAWAALDAWLIEAHARGLERGEGAEHALQAALHEAALLGAILERGGSGEVCAWRLPPAKAGRAAQASGGAQDSPLWEADPAAGTGAMVGVPW